MSREFVEALEEALRTLCERRFDDTEFLILYIDGVHAGGHQVIVAVGLVLRATNTCWAWPREPPRMLSVVKGLLEDLVARGITPEQPHLFIIDGAKALRSVRLVRCLGRTPRCNGAASTRLRT